MRKLWTMVAAVMVLGAGSALAGTAGEDVLGRQVPMGEGRSTVVLYANQECEEALGQYALPMLYSLREENPRVVVKVDLRDVPGLFHGAARSKIKKGYEDSLRDMRALFQKNGIEAPANMGDQFFIVADAKGESHQELGLPKGFSKPVVQAFGPDGKELARGVLPKGRERIERAVSRVGQVATARH